MKGKDFEKFVNGSHSLYGNKCVQCGKKMQKYDSPKDWEFAISKAKNVIFICAECIKGGKKNEPTKP